MLFRGTVLPEHGQKSQFSPTNGIGPLPKLGSATSEVEFHERVPVESSADTIPNRKNSTSENALQPVFQLNDAICVIVVRLVSILTESVAFTSKPF